MSASFKILQKTNKKKPWDIFYGWFIDYDTHEDAVNSAKEQKLLFPKHHYAVQETIITVNVTVKEI